ncbi:MAG: helix-turn-helix domain-containing protein [bacterium]|nr:helix-turn-helix domain-containing protein [bacterium]
MDIQNLLKEYGLSDKEIAVYLSLVNLGPSPVRTVASDSKVNRGTTYDILKSLLKQGLVSYHNKEAHQFFAAESPDKLVLALEQKQKDLEIVKTKIEENLPSLRLAFGQQGGKPVMKLYEGAKGIKQILQDILESVIHSADKTYYVYSSATVRKNVYQSMPDFSDRRIKKNIKVKTIALGAGGQVVGLDERKWLPAGKNNSFATYEIIYSGKVVHISLDNSDNPVGVMIENQAIYETQKMIFEFNWNQL